MGLQELCDSCEHLVNARWSLVGYDAPVDEDLRDGKSYWIIDQGTSDDGEEKFVDATEGNETTDDDYRTDDAGDEVSLTSPSNGALSGVNGGDSFTSESTNGRTDDRVPHRATKGASRSSRIFNGTDTNSSIATSDFGHLTDYGYAEPAQRSYAPFSHHNLYDILSNQKITCHLCRWIVDSLAQHAHKFLPNENEHIFAVPFLMNESIIDPSTKTLTFYYFWDDGRSFESIFAIYLYIRPLKPTDYPPSVNISHPLRPHTTAAIRKWGNECATKHEKCNALGRLLSGALPTAGGLPTRLLELDHDEMRPFVRLIQSSSLQPGTRYATLSHRWAESFDNPLDKSRSSSSLSSSSSNATANGHLARHVRVRLLRANEEDFKHRIPFAALPPVFADSVRATLALGLKYLWIDALCIRQDDAEDWAAESASMAWVYSQAHVNLAGTESWLHSAEGGNPRDVGLFCQSDQLLANPLVLRTSWPGSGLLEDVRAYERSNQDSKQGVPVAKTMDICPGWICFDEARWWRHVDRAPLNNRAWIQQERLLSPRTVHFARDQVWWSCREGQWCESMPGMAKELTMPAMPFAGGLGEHLLRANWEATVEAYTAAGMARADDRLIALAGIAWAFQVTHKYAPGQYIAGLWAHSLQRQLLWKVKGGGNVNRAPQTRVKPHGHRRQQASTSSLLSEAGDIAPFRRAPSWSWASVEGAVEWDLRTIGDDAKKIWFAWGMRSWFDGRADPFGPAVAARLRVDCMLYAVTVARLGTRYHNGNGASGTHVNGSVNGHDNSAGKQAVSNSYVVRSDGGQFNAAGAALGGLARISPDDNSTFFDGRDGSPGVGGASSSNNAGGAGGSSGIPHSPTSIALATSSRNFKHQHHRNDTVIAVSPTAGHSKAHSISLSPTETTQKQLPLPAPTPAAPSSSYSNSTSQSHSNSLSNSHSKSTSNLRHPPPHSATSSSSESTRAYFLPICIVDASHRGEHGGGHPTVSGLLIKPVLGADRGTYRRVGKLDMTYYRAPNVWALYREWMVGETLKPLLYQKDHGGRRYDIVLV